MVRADIFQLLPHRAFEDRILWVQDRIPWVHTRLFVQAIFSPRGPRSTKFFSKLRHPVRSCQVPFDYTWEWHTQESVTYVRTTHTGFRAAAQPYIGSTGQTVHRRELARRRKLIQLSRGRIAYYEPALKVWPHQSNLYQGMCIVLKRSPGTEQRLAFESTLIRKPNLNALDRQVIEQT